MRAAGPLIGRRLLITGASGGVGHYVTELAVAAGAEVTAVSATPERGAVLTALGAVVTSTEQAPGRYDIVMESVGGPSFAIARRKARAGGLVLWFGQASRTPVTLDFFDWIDGTADEPGNERGGGSGSGQPGTDSLRIDSGRVGRESLAQRRHAGRYVQQPGKVRPGQEQGHMAIMAGAGRPRRGRVDQ